VRVNFLVEDFLVFKYIGCATAARMIYRNLPEKDIQACWNSLRRDVDVAHFHTFGPWPSSTAHIRRASGSSPPTQPPTPTSGILHPAAS